MSRFGACSARISGDTHTHRHTDTQNDYRNPRGACGARVNEHKPRKLIQDNIICMGVANFVKKGGELFVQGEVMFQSQKINGGGIRKIWISQQSVII